jgi:hypothetical protein
VNFEKHGVFFTIRNIHNIGHPVNLGGGRIRSDGKWLKMLETSENGGKVKFCGDWAPCEKSVKNEGM